MARDSSVYRPRQQQQPKQQQTIELTPFEQNMDVNHKALLDKVCSRNTTDFARGNKRHNYFFDFPPPLIIYRLH